MSEEILKALMQLFAIIAKQDNVDTEEERIYVNNFLTKQVSPKEVNTYLTLFDEKVNENRLRSSSRSNTKLTSVTDSVRILKICKKINKTLDHRQKIISTILLVEMVANQDFSKQRMEIIHTVAEVFNINTDEFDQLIQLVNYRDKTFENKDNFIFANQLANDSSNHIEVKGLDGLILFLRIQSANLIVARYSGNQELILNGLPLTVDQCVVFNPGSTLKLPVGKPIYFTDIFERYNSNAQKSRLSFVANDISYKFSNGQFGLNPINISEHQNSLVAIMGASGSGKSTLINVLAGNLKPFSGSVRINGIDLYQNEGELEGVIGLIPQDDLLIENLSVYENLYFNARFCFANKTKEELTELVDNTLKSLDLFEIRHLAVGTPLNKLISGGQRKRLNIALELIREPSILFVDEPTSGLSSRDSENVMDLLRELSLKGKLIFVVIHQPSSAIYKIFDRIIMLDEGGYIIQYGNPVEVISYFKQKDGQASHEQAQCPSCGNVNAEQIFNIVHSEIVDEYGNYSKKRKKKPTDWHQYFLEEKLDYKREEENIKPAKNLGIPSKLKQSIIYFQRDLKSKLSNHTYLLIAFLEAPLLAFILSYLIRFIPSGETYVFRLNENLPQYIFMSIIVAMFIGLTISAEEIFRDRKMLKREAFLNLSKTSYLLAKMAILLIISASQAFLFVLIGNSIMGIGGMGFTYWFSFFSIAFFSNLLGLIISSTFDEVVTIYIIIPLLIIPQMVLGGAMFSFDKMNKQIVRVDKVPVIAEMMASKWAYEGIMVNQFVNNKFEKYFYELEKLESKSDFNQVYYIPELTKYYSTASKMWESESSSSQFKEAFLILQNEHNYQMQQYPELEIPSFSSMQANAFNQSTLAAYADFIEELTAIFNQDFQLSHNRLSKKRDHFINTQKETYYGLRNKYHNEAVSDIVCQFYEKNKILTSNNRLVQHVDAIYNDPIIDSQFDIRSHLFAPNKHFMGRLYATFPFNMSIIWLMNLLLFIILRTNIIRKIINFKVN